MAACPHDAQSVARMRRAPTSAPLRDGRPRPAGAPTRGAPTRRGGASALTSGGTPAYLPSRHVLPPHGLAPRAELSVPGTRIAPREGPADFRPDGIKSHALRIRLCGKDHPRRTGQSGLARLRTRSPRTFGGAPSRRELLRGAWRHSSTQSNVPHHEHQRGLLFRVSPARRSGRQRVGSRAKLSALRIPRHFERPGIGELSPRI